MASCAKKRQQRIAKRQQNRNTKKHFNPTFEQQVLETHLDENEENNSTEVETPVEETSVESETRKNKKVYDIKRGDIYFFRKGITVGVEQAGGRPGIIVSNNLCNKHSEFVEVVYTTCQPKTELPTHVDITSTSKPCIALCEQVHTISKERIECYYGEASPEEMVAVNKALKLNFSIEHTEDSESVTKLLQDNAELNNKIERLEKELLDEQKKAEGFLKDLSEANSKLQILSKLSLNKLSESNDTYKEVYDNLIDKILDRMQK